MVKAGRAMSREPQPIADVLADFSLAVTYESLPEEVRRDVVLRLLDAVGLAVSSSQEPFAKTALQLSRRFGGSDGVCTAIGVARGLTAEAAGFVNGTLVHGQDFDDTHTETLIHATACIAPAALALAELHSLSGSDTVSLAAIGYEVMIRIGLGAGPGAQMQARGFHGTAIAGACAVAAMAARASGQSLPVTRDAIAIATGLAAGLRQSVLDGTFAKAVQPGWAVQTGMWAAHAAEAGITGPVLAFEGARGLYASHAGLDLCTLSAVTDEIGSRWVYLATDIKLFPVCHHIQAPMDAALGVRREGGIAGAEDVEKIVVELSEQQVSAVCEPLAEKLRPATLYGVRFSLQYAVAVGIAYGAYRPNDIERALEDPVVQELARRVTCVGVPNPDYPRLLPVSVTATLRNGSQIERSYPSPAGYYGRAIEDTEIEGKFRDNTSVAFDEDAAGEIIAAIRSLAAADSVRDVFKLLSA